MDIVVFIYYKLGAVFMTYEDILEEIRTQISEKNINFLVGSGASMPYFSSLGEIEEILSDDTYKGLKELIYFYYYTESVAKNKDLIDENNQSVNDETGHDETENEVLISYVNFVRELASIMNNRNDRISPKRANIFTTNYDVFFEKAINIVQQNNPSLILNDGGHGYFNRYISADNYHKTVSRNGVFDNYHRELLTFNLIKCHGSVTWKKYTDVNTDKLEIKNNIDHITTISEKVNNIQIEEQDISALKEFLNNGIPDCDTIKRLNELADKHTEKLEEFFKEYQNLQIINPEKSKFNNTVIQEHYYSMLRLLSYELERDQTILIVFGFSFEDEHIRSLVKRSIHNPGLRVYIFSFSIESAERIDGLINSKDNKNIVIIGPQKDEKIDFNEFNKLLFGVI